MTSAATAPVGAPAPPTLSASFPASRFAWSSHAGSSDLPQAVVSFSEPLAAFSKSTPSIEVGGGTISAVSSHSEQGVENGYILFITPEGDGDVTVTLVADEECEAGGIRTAGGTRLGDVPATHTIAGPAETAAGKAPQQLSCGRDEGERRRFASRIVASLSKPAIVIAPARSDVEDRLSLASRRSPCDEPSAGRPVLL